eukprot:TRINITY_DN35618_c0_g1_i1.p1 TRINITY_DN35618_c0_g1~~TRINITY_DN35618_c0_g1_i1.p1  ORF type:complete len:504 (-),score=94.20 TRINITY_DN35618_c0_g1_i1:120-1631(-)
MGSDDADADDTDPVGSNLAPKGARSCEQSWNLQFSLQQIALCLSVGSWLLLCLVELAIVAVDGDFGNLSWWSYLIGGLVLLIALVLVVAGRMQARSAAERKFASVMPTELERSDEPKEPEDRKWNLVIHGHLVAGALLWIAVHVANEQYQQVWRGLTTLYSITGFGAVGVFCGRMKSAASVQQLQQPRGGDEARQYQQRRRPQADASSGDGSAGARNWSKPTAPVAAASAVEHAACARSRGLNSGTKRKWQPLFRDPTFGNSAPASARPQNEAPHGSSSFMVSKKSSTKSRASFRFVTENGQEEPVAARPSSRSCAGLFKFVEDCADAPPEAASSSSASQSQAAAESSPAGCKLRRQQSKNSHSSGGSALSDVSGPEEKPQAAAGTEVDRAISPETQPQKSNSSVEHGGSCGSRPSQRSQNSDGSALSDVSASESRAKAPAPAPVCQQPQPQPPPQLSSGSCDGGQRSIPCMASSGSAGSALSDVSQPPKPEPPAEPPPSWEQ